MSKLIVYSSQRVIHTEYESYPDAHWSWKWLFNRKESLSITGEVVAIFDILKALQEGRFAISGTKVIVRVSEWELKVSLDEETLKKHMRKRGAFAGFTEKDKYFDSDVRKAIQNKLLEAVQKKGQIEEKALHSLGDQLGPLFRSAGYTKIVIHPPRKRLNVNATSLPPSS